MYMNRKYYTVGFKTIDIRIVIWIVLIAIGSMAAVVYGVFAIFMIGHGLGYGDRLLLINTEQIYILNLLE